jgi:hypothetical protein
VKASKGLLAKEKWRDNACQDCVVDHSNFHTKANCPVYGLHLCVYHSNAGNQPDKVSFEKGFTIMKDPRFIDSQGGHWALCVELVPRRDKVRNTRGFMVMKNEFGKKEW